MRKLLCGILAGLLTLSLVACGSTPKTVQEVVSATNEEILTELGYDMEFDTTIMNDVGNEEYIYFTETYALICIEVNKDMEVLSITVVHNEEIVADALFRTLSEKADKEGVEAVIYSNGEGDTVITSNPTLINRSGIGAEGETF